jgi:hypothetical protein
VEHQRRVDEVLEEPQQARDGRRRRGRRERDRQQRRGGREAAELEAPAIAEQLQRERPEETAGHHR